MSGKPYAKALVRAVTGREVDDLLRELYIGERRSIEEIARSLSVSSTTVSRWLDEYGISREERPPLEPLVA